MVSLLQLAKIDETGVNFQSPYDGSHCMLTPEHSIEIQNSIGADIMMQLDDVVKTTLTGARVEEAMYRCGNRLDCIKIKQQKKMPQQKMCEKKKTTDFCMVRYFTERFVGLTVASVHTNVTMIKAFFQLFKADFKMIYEKNAPTNW